MTTTSDPLVTELAAVAGQYQHVAQSLSALDPYKEPVLLLRAKYASYEYITDLLNQRGVQLSIATVRKFCRKHNAEMRQLRHKIEDAKRKQNAPQTDIPISGDKTELLKFTPVANPGNNGPKIARDDI